MSMTTGTSYFVSETEAFRYYADYETDPAKAVKLKLKEGSIHIGKPPLKDGEQLLVIDNGTRYAIRKI